MELEHLCASFGLSLLHHFIALVYIDANVGNLVVESQLPSQQLCDSMRGWQIILAGGKKFPSQILNAKYVLRSK